MKYYISYVHTGTVTTYTYIIRGDYQLFGAYLTSIVCSTCFKALLSPNVIVAHFLLGGDKQVSKRTYYM